METLSTPSLTTFQVPKPSKLNNHHNHNQIKPPYNHHNNHPSTTTKTTTTSTSSFSTLQQKDTPFTPLNTFHYPTLHQKDHFPPPKPSFTHKKAASGYAAALLSISQCNNTILKVEKDVKRLLKVLRNGQVMEFMNDELVNGVEKGKVVKELLEKGKFDKGFVGLVNLVVDKGKVDLVKDVLQEFLFVFSQVCVGDNVSSHGLLAMEKI